LDVQAPQLSVDPLILHVAFQGHVLQVTEAASHVLLVEVLHQLIALERWFHADRLFEVVLAPFQFTVQIARLFEAFHPLDLVHMKDPFALLAGFVLSLFGNFQLVGLT